MESPVGRVERRHQRRALTRKHTGWRTAIVPGIVLGAAVLAVLRPVIIDHPEWFYLNMSDVLLIWDAFISGATLVITFLIPAQYFLALSHAFTGGSSAIARERMNGTWELLILTGLDTRHLVMGKWAGTVRALWLEWRVMLIPRFIGVCWLTIATIAQFPGARLNDGILVLIVLVVIAVSFVLPLFGAALASAMSVFASLLAKTPNGARNVLIGFQMFTFFGLLAMVVVVFPVIFDADWSVMFFPLIFGAIDGGLTLLLTLTSMLYQSPGLLTVVIALMVYTLGMITLIQLVLMLARRIARFQNVIAAEPLKTPMPVSQKTVYWTNNKGS